MRPPMTGASGSGGTWLAATIEARQRALDAAAVDARVLAAVRLARALTWSGDDGAAVRVLVNERRVQRKRGARGDVARCELGLAEIALISDDEDRAAVHLDAGADAPPEDLGMRQVLAVWIAARRGAQRPMPEVPDVGDAPWALELADGLAIELLWARGATEGLQVRGGDVRTRTLLEVITAVAERSVNGLQRALRSLEKAGLMRDLGRSILRVLGATPELLEAVGGSTTSWVARAQASIGDAATWRDRVATRHAWRMHGRRDADKAIPREVAVRLDARDRMRAHVQSTLAVGLDRQVKAADDLELVLEGADTGPIAHENLVNLRDSIDLLDAAASSALGELARVEGDLGQIVAATFAERERARAIATILAGLEGASDVDTLVDELANVVLEQLAANAVVIAERVPHVGLRAIVTRGIEAEDDSWIDVAEQVLDMPLGSRPRDMVQAVEPAVAEDRRGGSEIPPGPTLVVPMRASGTDGAIYVDKRATGGTFSAADAATLELLASYGGLALARLRATNAAAALGRRLAGTIDAMRDGLLALDREGVITAVNETACRALRLDQSRLLGRRIDAIPDLAPLAAALQNPADGLVVRLANTSIVVHARELDGEGTVATIVEYERAQKIAQKLVGPRSRYTFGDLRGNDPALLQALDIARRASTVDASVLIVGESGTGKELVAQAIHSAGPRAREPFVAINCAALPRELLEAELFGYERGAFTGARAEGSVGKFELAGDGTILLDEIVDMPLDMQVKLLRVLQERVVVRLGSSVERPVRARVMATAQRDLTIDVERGRFRLDLLHRLRVLQITLPALRQRPGDIIILANHYLRTFAERQSKTVRELSPDVETALVTYAWPGNIRELANVIEGEVSLLPPNATVLDRVPASVRRSSDPPPSGAWSLRESSLGIPSAMQIPVRESNPGSSLFGAGPILPLAEVERRAYLEAYERCNRSVTRAAKALGVSKVTFYGKLRQFGMHPAEVTGEVPAFRATSSRIAVAEPIDPPSSAEQLAYPEDPPPPSRRR
ncbi:MAG: sigma 54-interacting transcriptional regulator [Deltaproteobacteria bacterium]|nr:sigma 54-interacting transcriptional regulator [Deltaproteobacteria bacterium]